MIRSPLTAIPLHQPTPETGQRTKVAVILNGNARSVNDQLISDLRGLLQDEVLYVSHSLDQSKFIARHVVNQGFDVVLCGGGDGTFTQVVTDIAQLRPTKMPAVGILRLGTGNAMAEVLGAAEGGLKALAADLRSVRKSENRVGLSLLSSEGKLSPFAGVGLDALILEDYGFTRNTLGRVLGKACEGPLGYALAIAGRSAWRLSTKPLPEVVIRNEGKPAYRMDLAGRRIGTPVARGEIIYRGPVTMAAASTIPYYGFRLKLFPQTDTLTGRFQLRVGVAKPTAIISQLPAIFRGEFRSETMWDYACSAISIACAEGTPYQIGGDLQGTRHHMRIGVQEFEGACGSATPAVARSKHPHLRSVG